MVCPHCGDPIPDDLDSINGYMVCGTCQRACRERSTLAGWSLEAISPEEFDRLIQAGEPGLLEAFDYRMTYELGPAGAEWLWDQATKDMR